MIVASLLVVYIMIMEELNKERRLVYEVDIRWLKASVPNQRVNSTTRPI